MPTFTIGTFSEIFNVRKTRTDTNQQKKNKQIYKELEDQASFGQTN